MSEQHVVRIRYTSRDGDTTHPDVEPVMFAARNGQWYLIGWCRLRSEMRWFLVPRIEHATATRIRAAATASTRSARLPRRPAP